MSETSPDPVGPVMLVATNMLRAPATRIGRISKDIVLPRTIPLKGVIGGIVGLLLGLMLAVPFGSLEAIVFGAIGGVAAGVAAVTLSPIQGESFLKWLGLSAANIQKKKVKINGMPAKVYIGIAPLSYTAEGKVLVKSGSVPVIPGTVDERGVIIPHSEALRANRDLAKQLSSSRGHQWAPKGEGKALPATPKQNLESLRKQSKGTEIKPEVKSAPKVMKPSNGIRPESIRSTTPLNEGPSKRNNLPSNKGNKLPANKSRKLK